MTQLELPFGEYGWELGNPICDHMLPQAEPDLVNYGDYLPSCLLSERHDGSHLILTSEGKFYIFDTEFSTPELFRTEPADTVYLYAEASSAEAAQMLANSRAFSRLILDDKEKTSLTQ